MKTTTKRWLPLLLYALLLLGISTIPSSTLEKSPWAVNDKVAHTILYAGLGWTAQAALGSPAAAVASAWLFGALDENYQRLTPGRTCSVEDWLADGLGIVLGVLASLLYGRLRR